MAQSAPRYERAPSDDLLALLSPGGFLRPLLELGKREVAGLPLDVHLRPKDEVHVYCGLTRVLRAKRASGASAKVWAHATYRKQPCAKPLFRSWSGDGRAEFEAALAAYVEGVQVNSRHTQGEGRVQCLWSRITDPWFPFDRESVLAESPEGESFEQVDSARAELEAIVKSRSGSDRRRDRWQDVPSFGEEADQLAVDPEGHLVLIELKHASAKAGAKAYYAPFQLLHYVWQWHEALEAIREDLQELISARVALGLPPSSVPPITRGIRPIVGFGLDCRSPEVKRRYSKVLQVVNQHLPPRVPPIETWAFADGAARPELVES